MKGAIGIALLIIAGVLLYEVLAGNAIHIINRIREGGAIITAPLGKDGHCPDGYVVVGDHCELRIEKAQ